MGNTNRRLEANRDMKARKIAITKICVVIGGVFLLLLIFVIAIICFEPMLFFNAFNSEDNQSSAKEIISTFYSACKDDFYASLTTELELPKASLSGWTNHIGEKILISDDGLALYQKKANMAPTRCLMLSNVEIAEQVNEKLHDTKGFSIAEKNEEYPSEFRSFEINKDFNGAVGYTLTKNSFYHYAIYPKSMDQLEATHNVCSAFYSEYDKWTFRDSSLMLDDILVPTLERTIINDSQLRLTDDESSLVTNLYRWDFISGKNNLGKCISGMLGIPYRIRNKINEDGMSNKNYSTSYEWGNYKADAVFNNGDLELIIYKK